MHQIKILAASITAVSSSSYTLFELAIKGTTGMLGLGAGVLGFAAGYYAFRSAKKRDANEDLQREILLKQLNK
jgi:uncharacterized membrane protein (Fun14 family)